MPSWAEVLRDGTIGGEELLRVSWGLEPLHPALSLAGGLMRIFRAVVQIAMLAMLDARQELTLGRPIALQLIRDQCAWDVSQAFQWLAEEFLGRRLIATALDQDIEDIPVLVNGAPERMMLPMNREKDFIEMPGVARPRAPAAQLIGGRLPELPAPLADGIIGHDHPTDEHQPFDIPVAEAEAKV
jgi:hypothetical protein